MVIPRVVIAGTASGVGKTTVATGIMAALARRGYKAAPFKVGPDFIDPSYHSVATGLCGRNLDVFLSGEGLIGPLFSHGAGDADIAVIEGVMGLFDGKSGAGEFASTAHVAKLLRAPVVLVVDCQAMARSVAALVAGFANFDPKLWLGGVILNQVGSVWHEEIVRAALSALEVPVLGVLYRSSELKSPERHLGLVPAAEQRAQTAATVSALAGALEAGIDWEPLLAIARRAGQLKVSPWKPDSKQKPVAARVAVAGGPAFSFVYRENLELLAASTAEVVRFDPLTDHTLPEGTDGVYLGGGFPEAFAPALAENRRLRAEIAAFAASGRPVVAECGGLLYLCRDLDGLAMCGVIDARAQMTDRLTLGYREARAQSASSLCEAGTSVRGHEFHYSRVDPPSGRPCAWMLTHAGSRRPEGFVQRGLNASFLHTHWASHPHLPRRLAQAAAHAGAPTAVAAGARQ